ncbi:hypothetical protein BDC45DRAFT_561173 [Circinella umbellata]|nr:hypothetical protein BDC45DRAFT_561173 [Circinella umbellata]
MKILLHVQVCTIILKNIKYQGCPNNSLSTVINPVAQDFFVCCICNNLHDSVTELNNHFEIHLVSSDQSAELSLPSSSTTPTITTPRPEITTKRPYTDNINTGSKIKIIKSQKTITFDTTLASKIIPLNTPKISKVDREKLSDIYTFIMQTYDKMTQEELSVIRKHQDDQRKLVSLVDNHSSSFNIIKQALSSCRTHMDLDDYKFPALDHATNSFQQHNFYRTLKHVLIDFTSKCFRTVPIFSNHERTFFADRVIPILSAFENYHQNIHFEWCEKNVKSAQIVSSFTADFQRAGRIFADGLGYSTLIGHMDDERIVIEASSGGYEENQEHTEDDALKLLKTLTSIIVLKAYDLKNARFKTFTKFKVISIQVIKRKLTLSVLYMGDDKKFIFEERRSGTIPVTYNERYNWLQIFEILADFEQLLNEQDEIEDELRQENVDSEISEEETIRAVFQSTDHLHQFSNGSRNNGVSLDNQQ